MDPVTAYITSFLHPPSPQLARIEAQEERLERVQPNVGCEVGQLLTLLIRLTRARRVLELGTCIGYSAIWLGQALRTTEGTLISVECEEERVALARANIEEAGLSGIVRLVHGDAAAVLKDLEGPFDLILQDAGKPSYPLLLGDCLRLLREGGILVADDTLFRPRGVRAELSDPMHWYNEMVFARPDLCSTILPIGDGITVSVKEGR